MRSKLNLILILIFIWRINCQQVQKVPDVSNSVSVEEATGNVTENSSKPISTTEAIPSLKKGKEKPSNYKKMLSCVRDLDLSCAIDKSEDILEETRVSLLAQADLEARQSGRSKDSDTPTELVNTIGDVVTEVSDIVTDGISGFFRTGKEDDDDDDDEEVEEVKKSNKSEKAKVEDRSKGVTEARGKKKKKKLIALIKLIILGAVLKAKIGLLLKALAVKIQIKFLLIALAGLLLNAARFWLDLKKGHHPQKVIYYEHAQHQHHYEGGEDDWGSSPSGGGGGGGGWWGRAYEVGEGEQKGSAHDMAYAKQKPTYIGRVSEKPSLFWG